MSDNQQPNLHLESPEKRIETLLAHLEDIITHVEKFSREKNPIQINGQLVAIAETVRKLEKQGITIPDDLRKLKINLSSDLCKVEDMERLRTKLVHHLQASLTRVSNHLPSAVKANTPAPAPQQPPSKRRKKKAVDEKSMDLFTWPQITRN